MTTHSSTLAWKIPGTEEAGRLPSMGLQRVRHHWGTSLLINYHLEADLALSLIWEVKFYWHTARSFTDRFCLFLHYKELSNRDHMACVCMLTCFSHVQLFATLWTVACQDPLSLGFSRQKYWSGLPCPPPGDLPNPGIELVSSLSPALQKNSFPLAPPGKFTESIAHFKCLDLTGNPWSYTMWLILLKAPR